MRKFEKNISLLNVKMFLHLVELPANATTYTAKCNNLFTHSVLTFTGVLRRTPESEFRSSQVPGTSSSEVHKFPELQVPKFPEIKITSF